MKQRQQCRQTFVAPVWRRADQIDVADLRHVGFKWVTTCDGVPASTGAYKPYKYVLRQITVPEPGDGPLAVFDTLLSALRYTMYQVVDESTGDIVMSGNVDVILRWLVTTDWEPTHRIVAPYMILYRVHYSPVPAKLPGVPPQVQLWQVLPSSDWRDLDLENRALRNVYDVIIRDPATGASTVHVALGLPPEAVPNGTVYADAVYPVERLNEDLLIRLFSGRATLSYDLARDNKAS